MSVQGNGPGEAIVLQETAISGSFFETFGFEDLPVPGNGEIYALSDGVFTVTYNDHQGNDGQQTTVTAEGRWRADELPVADGLWRATASASERPINA